MLDAHTNKLLCVWRHNSICFLPMTFSPDGKPQPWHPYIHTLIREDVVPAGTMQGFVIQSLHFYIVAVRLAFTVIYHPIDSTSCCNSPHSQSMSARTAWTCSLDMPQLHDWKGLFRDRLTEHMTLMG